MKKHTGFIIFFASLLIFYLWELITMRGAFLGGDYASQFYPWSSIYADAIKGLRFPFWTRYFQSGFPMIAEGQVGGFYPLNLLFFFFLPFKAAYNYIVILHFAMAGIFTYMYSRKLGACQWGGTIAALIFCFGSAYAGCFYNTVTMKTLIWVPLVLFLFENYFDNKRVLYVWGAGVVLGLQMVAGFAQVACYSAVFYALYFVCGLFSRKDMKVNDILLLAGAFSVSVLMFFPQFFLSWNLAAVSVRAEATLDFALWGSFPPVNFMSIVFPYWISHGTRFYSGIISLIFIIVYFMALKRDAKKRPLFVMFILAILLALGKYNPLFVLALKVTQFYSFRNPSKILFFAMFASSVMAGCGFTMFASEGADALRKKSLRIGSIFLGGMAIVFLAGKAILTIWGNRIIELGQLYAANYIFGKSYHRHSMERYMTKVENIYNSYLDRASLAEPLLMVSFILIVIVVLLWRYYEEHPFVRKTHKILLSGIIFIDLYSFSFYGAGWGGTRNFDILDPETPKLYETVKNNEKMFRILPYGLASGRIPNWAQPNLNAVYRIDSTAVYSPLACDKYKEALEGLEMVDESLGLLEPDINELKKYGPIIRALNVKYVISSEELNEDFLLHKADEDGVYLYEVKSFLPRTYISDDLEGSREREGGRLETYAPGHAVISVIFDREKYVVLSEYNYPGWSVFVDGEKQKLMSYRTILMAVRVSPGAHIVEFKYSPYFTRGREGGVE